MGLTLAYAIVRGHPVAEDQVDVEQAIAFIG